MTRTFSLLLCLSFFSSILAAQNQEELNKIKRNYIASLTGTDTEHQSYLPLLSTIPREEEVSDQNVVELQQLYPIGKEEIRLLTDGQNADGSWPDINYADTKRSGWEPKQHTERILKLTKYYCSLRPDTGSKEATIINHAIHRAMNYWFTEKPVCKNWWYNQIGIPRTLGPAFLLFEQEMTPAEKQEAIRVMEQSRFGMAGQNKVWLAGNVLMRGLLQGDYELVKAARDTICSEIVLGQPEGIQPDWSFHQHGPQQQFGNYGLSFICNMAFYSGLFAGTTLAFTPDQQNILVSFLLNGYRWIVWKGYWDVNGLNRQLFRNADIHKPFNLLFAAGSLMKGSTPAQASEIKTFIDRNFLHPGLPNTFTGNKFFNYSDLTLHRTPKWMASVRMASDRVIGTELINEDNLKGYYMADGALYTYVRGDEYHNIFPFWNWRHIPGITTYESDAPVPTQNGPSSRNHSSLTGGATDGHTGITAMQLNRNGLNARKAWIFTDDYVVCMGSDIHSDSTSTLLTSIDQRFKKGEVWNKDNRYFHDGTGYIVMQADSCIAITKRRQGQWHDFMGMYTPQMLEDEIFSIYLRHPQQQTSSYLYLILPATTLEGTANFDTSTILVLQNDAQAQVVLINGVCYAAVWKSDTLLRPNNGKELLIEKPGIYLFNPEKGVATGSNYLFIYNEPNLHM